MMTRLWITCVLACVAPATGGAQTQPEQPPTERLAFGALALDYDSSVWTPEDDMRLVIQRQDASPVVVVGLSVANAGSAPCSLEAMERLARSWHTETAADSRTLRLGDLVVHVGVVHLGCRNLAGAAVAACAEADGQLHRITAIGGCMDLHHTNSDQVLKLLEGLTRP